MIFHIEISGRRRRGVNGAKRRRRRRRKFCFPAAGERTRWEAATPGRGPGRYRLRRDGLRATTRHTWKARRAVV